MKRPKESPSSSSKKQKHEINNNNNTSNTNNEETKNDSELSDEAPNTEKEDKDMDKYIAVCEEHGIQLKSKILIM